MPSKNGGPGTTRTVGAVMAVGGFLLMYAAYEALNMPDIAGVGMLIGGTGAIIVYFDLDSFYCQSCGQRLGKVAKPSECGRCGSNRIQKRDPGASGVAPTRRRR